MNATQAQAAYAALYAPTSVELARELPAVADCLQASMHQLARAPTAEGAEHVARQASAVAAHAMKLALACQREGHRFGGAS